MGCLTGLERQVAAQAESLQRRLPFALPALECGARLVQGPTCLLECLVRLIRPALARKLVLPGPLAEDDHRLNTVEQDVGAGTRLDQVAEIHGKTLECYH